MGWSILYNPLVVYPHHLSDHTRTVTVAPIHTPIHSKTSPIIMNDKYLMEMITPDASLPRFHLYSQSSLKRYEEYINTHPYISFVQFCSLEEKIAQLVVDKIVDQEDTCIFLPHLFLEPDSVESFLTQNERKEVEWIVDSLERNPNADTVIMTITDTNHI